jgi:hypothetical protein
VPGRRAEQGKLALGLGIVIDVADIDRTPSLGGVVDLAARRRMLRPVAEEVDRRQHGFHTRLIGFDHQEVEFLHHSFSLLHVWRSMLPSGSAFFIGAGFPSPATLKREQ